MLDNTTLSLAKQVADRLIEAGHMVVTAESCTGGLIASALTTVTGSSAILHGGFITYSNAAKIAMIGVPSRLIEDHGAVSEQVARAMAEGAREATGVDLAISVTGVAGPGGGSEGKPVGLVHFALATRKGTLLLEKRFGDIGRDAVREASVRSALELILEAYAP